MRVAIVGAGPRGLFAVERLWAHAAPGTCLDVVLFDPRDPGVGAAYDPTQPEYLRLNVNSAVVSAAWPGEDTIPSFNAWRLSTGEREPLEPFPPRALVGRYLGWFWGWLNQQTPSGSLLAHRSRNVAELAASGAGWVVDGEIFDEVLLATGHERSWPGQLHGDGVIPAVFPVQRWLGEDDVPPGCRVAFRGAALTFIDAALALTEGRGGRFIGDWATGLAYERSGREPRTLWPVGRSGRWMDPKPQPGTLLAEADPEILRVGRAAVLSAESPTASLGAVHTTAVALGAAPDRLASLLDPGRGDATAALRQRLTAVAGSSDPGTSWALGHAWRGLYDALRYRFEGTVEGFAPFARLASTLERVAFGPPPVNAAKILALIEAGLIDPTSLERAHFDGASPIGLPAAPDVIVDAVLPPPGVVPGSLVGRLVDDGVIVSPAGRRGVAVAPDANCLDRDGVPVPGLACIGRATEDVVIGNDTLNRALHPAVDLWARRITQEGSQ